MDDQQAQYENEYWALDAEAYAVCIALAPDFGGASVGLSDLDELCRRMNRPMQNDRERMQLMNDLDPENTMRIDRQTFTTWLFQDLYTKHQAQLTEAANVATAFIAEPAWEEIVDDQGQQYFYNTLTGATSWELPRFAACLRVYLDQMDEIRGLKAASLDAILEFPDPAPTPNPDVLDDLHEAFIKFDDDASGDLDASEFQDLCVAIDFLVGLEPGFVEETMAQIDPSGSSRVAWDALRCFFINHTPFQRRVRLSPPLEQWELIEPLDSRVKSVKYRHTTTLSERWSHPETEQRMVDVMLKLLPSSKLDWSQRIAMFVELQAGAKAKEGERIDCHWSLAVCRRILAQVGHACGRLEHLLAAVAAIGATHGNSSDTQRPGLDPDTVTRWLKHCVARVEMEGWEEVVDETTGQQYYYHEIHGVTQWDPPHLEANMSKMLARFGGDGGSSSAEDRIRKIFRHYDEDESGSISFQEFKRLYIGLIGRREALDADADDRQIQEIFRVLDTSGDDAVNVEEFLVWWKTKLNLADEETTDQRAERLLMERARTATEFLVRHDALVVDPENGTQLFESNMLPRLVSVLGKYSIQGLAYRNALHALVVGVAQQVELSKFLDWYTGFEGAQREKEELQLEKARALARIHAEEAKAQEKARQLKMLRKGQLLTRAIAQDVSAPPEPAEIVWKRHIETLFRKFDTDGSGYLDADELHGLTAALGHAMTTTQVAQTMCVMDSSGDGCVSLDEFLTFWTAYQRRKQAGKTLGITTIQKSGTSRSAAATRRREGVSMVPTPTSASVAVSLELAKDRALQLTMEDFTDALGDLKDALLDRSKRKKEAKRRVERERQQVEELERSHLFIPTTKRRYAHVDVTWIESEVVRCMVDMISWISSHARPRPRQDAAQRIQQIWRGGVTRMRVLASIQKRFLQHVDIDTGLYYYTDMEARGSVWLHRPVFRTLTSSTSPWEITDCRDKIQRLAFTHRLQRMQRKQAFYHQYICPAAPEQWRDPVVMRLYVPSSFVMFHVLDSVGKRMLGSLWTALRARLFVLAELMATRHTRQLTVRSDRDAARPLPLHYAVQHHTTTPFRLLQAMYLAYPDAVREVDGYGRTPLHLAFRERAPRRVLELLLSQRHRLMNEPTRQNPMRTSVWVMQSMGGDTPLHVALRYGISLELLRWLLRHETVARAGVKVWTTRNGHGLGLLHMVVAELFDRSAYAKSVVHVLLRLGAGATLCSSTTADGDLALHVAIQRCSEVDESERVEAWVWLIRTLVDAYPGALATRRTYDPLLAMHLLIRTTYLPEDFVIEMLDKTVGVAHVADSEEAKHKQFTLDGTGTTLLHYVLLHRPQDSRLANLVMDQMPTSPQRAMQLSGDLPLHIAVRNGTPPTTVQRLCELHGFACQARNSHQELPIHLAAMSPLCSEHVVRILLHHCPFVFNDPEERRGLRAIVMACNANVPNAGVIRALLDGTPEQKLRPSKSRHVTPLYAVALRMCDSTLQQSGVLNQLIDKFDRIEDEDAYFLAMAQAKHRKRHHCPTTSWTFPQMLELMARNPLNEAILQRSFLAMNDKLAQMQTQPPQPVAQVEATVSPETDDLILGTVTLNPDWMLVRRVHEVMYETPQNARLQLLGQAILNKLLPTAFAKAAYKHRIDPYFDL